MYERIDLLKRKQAVLSNTYSTDIEIIRIYLACVSADGRATGLAFSGVGLFLLASPYKGGSPTAVS
jgi:hypothetical protein